MIGRENDDTKTGIFIYQTKKGISVKDTTEAGERVFINEGIDSNTPITKKVAVALKTGDFIRFDTSEIWRLETLTFRVCHINLMPKCFEDMKDGCEAIGATFVDELNHQCTHLVMKEIELKADFLLALIYEVEIVTPNYWIAFIERVKNQLALPDPKNFRPIVIDLSSNLNIEPNLLHVNSNRVNVFREKTFLFATKVRMDNFKHIIALCKGKCINMEENYVPKTLLKYYILVAEEISQEYEGALKFHGRRSVPEIEISMAIIHASTDQFCNADLMVRAPKSALTNNQSQPSTSSTSNQAPETNEKKVKCTYCNKSFGHYSNMIRHRTKEHSSSENQKKYECYLCKQSGSTLFNLQVHLRRVHLPKIGMEKNLPKTGMIKKKRPKLQSKVIPKPYHQILENIWVAGMPKKISTQAKCHCHPGRCDDGCLNVLSNIECSAMNCKSSNCENRKFRYLVEDRTNIRYVSENVGFGLFADRKINQGDLITQYLGEVIDKKEYQRRHAKNNKLIYFMVLGSKIIDASFYGNNSRFINNSCNPNADFIKWEVNGLERIGIFAKRDILKASSVISNIKLMKTISIFFILIFSRTKK